MKSGNRATDTKAWEPVLATADAEAAREAVDEIAAFLRRAPDDELAASYSGGFSGLALFYGYLALAGEDDGAAAIAENLLCLAMQRAGDRPSLGFFSGLSGIGWTVQHLSMLLTGESLKDLTEDFDRLIEGALQGSSWPWDFDLVDGLAGIGSYLADHPDRDFSTRQANRVVQQLEQLAEPGANEGVTWRSSPQLMPRWKSRQFPSGCHDLGVAHGIGGVIGALARMCSVGLGDVKTRSLLEAAVRWLLDHQRPGGQGSTFSCFAQSLDQSCRSAWCYGDPGIASVLWNAASVLGRQDWQETAISIARADCSRPDDVKGVADASLCHGTSGLAHLYHRMSLATEDRAFAEAARFWYRETLSRRNAGDLSSYLNHNANEDSTRHRLLTGACGVGLALLAGYSKIEPNWDRPMHFAERK